MHIRKRKEPTGCMKAGERVRIGNELPCKAEPAMRRVIATTCVLAMLTCGVRAQQPSPQTPSLQKAAVAKKPAKKKRASVRTKTTAAAPAMPLPAQTMPPVPATLMNSNPVKPTVTMASGLLTIDAPNCTLSDVLDEVQKATGAAIEGESPTERVAVKLGPGDPEQVIAALLHGTPYDYVILGSLGSHDVVTRVLLTQSASGEDQSAQEASGVSGRHPLRGFRPRQLGDNPPDHSASEDVDVQPAIESEPDTAPQQSPAKSPDQLLKELQQLEQQKQQK